MVTANTLTATITVVDTRPTVNGLPNPNEDKVVKMLVSDPGCHGVQYGAKKGGGYYAYVSNKFSNANARRGSGPQWTTAIPRDATVVGRNFADGNQQRLSKDGTISEYAGMGGQGVLRHSGCLQRLGAGMGARLHDQRL